MAKAFFLATLSALFYLYENVAAAQSGILCDKVDLIQFIEFPSEHKSCLQVAFEKDHEVSCVLISLGFHLIFFKITSIQTLSNRNISSETGEKCETFLIFAESLADVKEIIRHNRSDTKQFFPFSKIYLYIFDQFNGFSTGDIATATRLKTFLIENALFGYIFEQSNQKVLIRDLLTNDLKKSIVSYTPSDLFHPIVDTRLAKDFRISLFNCAPYSFYPENASYNTKVNEIDGTEIRFVKEVTKNWKKIYNFRDFSQTKLSPYFVMEKDISNGSANMAMCSIWVLNKNNELYDLTKFYEGMCLTFMVPKPIELHAATAIYAGLSVQVWMSFLCVFLLSSVSLNFFSKMDTRLHRRHDRYTDFARTFIETVSIVTSQPLHRFSTTNKVSAQIVLTRQRAFQFLRDSFEKHQTEIARIFQWKFVNGPESWILFSVWIDVCYSTIYTSRITSPSFEKPVDTVKQFLEHDMYICARYASDDFLNELRSSINEYDRKLGARSLVYGYNEQYRQRLIAERKCGLSAVPLLRKYIVLQDENEDLMHIFRLMKSCVSIQYSAFAFQKYSPYTKLFDWHIRRFQEHGLIAKWYLDMIRMGRVVLFDDTQQKSFHQITVVGVSGSFMLLSCGLALSVASFLAEIVFDRWHGSKRGYQAK